MTTKREYTVDMYLDNEDTYLTDFINMITANIPLNV